MCVVTDAQADLLCVLIAGMQCAQLPCSLCFFLFLSLSLCLSSSFLSLFFHKLLPSDTFGYFNLGKCAPQISSSDAHTHPCTCTHTHATNSFHLVRDPSPPSVLSPYPSTTFLLLPLPPPPLFSSFFGFLHPPSPPLYLPFPSSFILHSQRCDVGERLRLNIETEGGERDRHTQT